jgi:uncharacterized protein (TIGR04141 family)
LAETEAMMLSLNAVLLRRKATPANAWSQASLANIELFYWTDNGLESLDLADTDVLDAATPGDIIIAILRRFAVVPAWQRFLRDSLNLTGFGSGGGQSLGAAIFCCVSPEDSGSTLFRWMAWTFGTASRALSRANLDPRFGLIAVLNLMVLPLLGVEHASDGSTTRNRGPQLREIRYRTTAPYVQQTGHRAARDIPVDGFRVDRSSDLIATVGGSGADPALTTSTVLGGRSLRFRAAVRNIADLVELAEIAVDRSRAVDYREAFSWIDNIKLVDDEDLIAQLRAHLAGILTQRPDSPSIDAILPDDLIEAGEDRSIRYILFPRERGTGQGRITLTTTAIAALLGRFPDPAVALDAELRFLDESNEFIGAATALECLSANMRVAGKEFIAYDGEFYEVNSNFVVRINQEVMRIPNSSLIYPSYHGETEPQYNSMVGRDYPQDFIELDRALIEMPGEYGVEASDLVAASGALIHVKRKGKSSTLSHLFLQAANSCELLRRAPETWDQVRMMMEQRARDPETAARAAACQATAQQHREAVEVAFGFLGDWRNRSVMDLPLFSRISLVNETRRIGNLGFRATVALISL